MQRYDANATQAESRAHENIGANLARRMQRLEGMNLNITNVNRESRRFVVVSFADGMQTRLHVEAGFWRIGSVWKAPSAVLEAVQR